MTERICVVCQKEYTDFQAECGNFFHRKCSNELYELGWGCLSCNSEKENALAEKILITYKNDPKDVKLDKETRNILAKYIIENDIVDFEEMLEYLKDQGWNIEDSIDHRESSALILACQSSNIPALKYLIKNGANINRGDYFKMSGMHYACDSGFLEVLKLLLTAGTDVDAKNLDNHTPIIFACKNGQVECLKHLLDSEAGKNGPDGIIAVVENQKLIEEGIKEGQIRILELLLQYDAELRVENSSYYLKIACENDRLEALKFLISKGVNLNSLDEHQNTALHFAARFGGKEMIEFLLENGFDIYAKNYEQRSPFLEACLFKNLRNMKLLHEKGGADRDLKDANQNTPFHLYRFESADDYYAFFFIKDLNGIEIDARNANGDTALMKSCESDWTGHIPCEFLSAGADINAVNSEGMTPFLFACRSSTKYNARILAKKGVDVNCKTKTGQTGLHLNAKSDRIRVIEELVHLGVDIEAADNEGNRFIHLFTQNLTKFDYFTRKILVDILKPAGLDFNALDGKGRSPLALAALYNCPQEYIDTLIECGSKPRFAIKKNTKKNVCIIQ